MTPSLRSGGYRNFFNLLCPFPMNTNFKLVLFIIIKVFIHEIKNLRKNGIMTPSLRSGGYRSFPNFLPPTPSDYRTNLTLLLADEQIQLAPLVPTRIPAMEPSPTSLSLLTVTIISSNASSVDDYSTNRVITCTNLLPSFGLQALMDLLSNCFSYLCAISALTFVRFSYFVLSLFILVTLATLYFVSFK
ncbi:hypothetical protein ISN44_As07g018290 [Arabidopsis suecica]|uniref:Uncharacterized protein n=1 Tax=Arabidopsis suecica TaxID=45249 RepID=A0A8T2BQ84_ARASU|nr:hypothetical protein ISN44_As07g018290 [Arabidopsis suecica]